MHRRAATRFSGNRRACRQRRSGAPSLCESALRKNGTVQARVRRLFLAVSGVASGSGASGTGVWTNIGPRRATLGTLDRVAVPSENRVGRVGLGGENRRGRVPNVLICRPTGTCVKDW